MGRCPSRNFYLRGVRNAQARNNLAAMRKGDPVLFYHSQQELAIVGVMEVTREAYPDPTSTDSHTGSPATLGRSRPCPAQSPSLRLKPTQLLSEALPLVRQPRLSVMPVSPEEYKEILRMVGDILHSFSES